jgi:hypothetical protein
MVLVSAKNNLLFQAGKELLSKELVLVLSILLDSLMNVRKLQANRGEVHNFLADEHLLGHFFNFSTKSRCYNLRAEADS